MDPEVLTLVQALLSGSLSLLQVSKLSKTVPCITVASAQDLTLLCCACIAQRDGSNHESWLFLGGLERGSMRYVAL